MEGGRVRLTGAAAEVLANPEIADLYLGGTIRRAPQGSQGSTSGAVAPGGIEESGA
jgi:hypothetical protein